MRINLETDYAIRMVGYLSENRNNLIGAAAISAAADIPLRFAKNILQKLAGAGIIKSRSGIYGGYKLSRLPGEISLYDVIESIQGPITLSRQTPGEPSAYNKFFKQLSLEMESKLRKVNFEQFIENPNKQALL